MDVKLIRITEEPEEIIAMCYGICTNKAVPVENIPRWIKLGHLTPVESASATFLIEGISRACLAQITRHRLTSFSVKSQRYIDMAAQPQIVPETIAQSGLLSEYAKHLGSAQTLYQALIDKGVPKEDARMALPIATTTELFMTANFRQLRHMIKLRTHPSSQWEIREVFNKILAVMIDAAPNVFSDLSIERQKGENEYE